MLYIENELQQLHREFRGIKGRSLLYVKIENVFVL